MLVGRAGAQGQFYFNNRIGTEVNARFVAPGDPCDGNSSSVASPEWSVRLLGGPIGTPVSQLLPLDPPGTTFRGAAGTPLAGYVVGITPTVPGVEVGASAWVVVRLVGPSGFLYDAGLFTVYLGGGVVPPPNLELGTAPIGCIPEPTVLALLSAVLMILGCRRMCGRVR